MVKQIVKWSVVRAVVAVVVFLAAVLFFWMSAGRDYSITRYSQDVTVNQQGAALVKKTISYKFDGDHQGIILREAGGKDMAFTDSNMTDLDVRINGGAWKSPKNIETQSYTANQIAVKVYQTLKKGDTLQVRYWYNVSGLAKRWQDTAEINWVLADSWAVPLKNVTVKVHLPKGAGHVQAWGHTEFGDTDRVVVSGRTISLTSSQVKANGRLELHSLFGKTALNSEAVTRSGKRVAAAKEIEQNITLSNTLRLVGVIVVFVALAIALVGVLVYGLRLVMRKQKVADMISRSKQTAGVSGPVVHFFDTPTTVGPAVGYDRQTVLTRNGSNDDPQEEVVSWYATILDLVARHYIDIHADGQAHVAYQRTTKSEELPPFEQEALAILFAGDQTEVTDEDFSSANSALSKALENRLGQFTKLARKAADTKSMVDQQATHAAKELMRDKRSKLQKRLPLLAPVLGLLALIFIWQGNVWLLTLSVLVLVFMMMNAYGLALVQTTVLKPDGYGEVYHWDGFELMLNDLSNLDRADLPDVVLWDRLFAFAVVYGIVDKVAAQLPRLISDAELDSSVFLSSNDVWTSVATYSVLDNLFDNDGIFAPEESSSSSDSFSDGSGFDGFSGGDGGSGGDAF